MVNEMVKILAKCPKCGTEKEVKRMLGSESAEGDCDDFSLEASRTC